MSKLKAIILCCVICIFVAFIFGISFWRNDVQSIGDIFVSKTALENTYYLSQILCTFIVLVGGFVGIWQYSLAKKAEKNQFHNARVQKAIDLAEYYKDNIINNINFIEAVYKKLEVFDLLDNVDINNINVFNYRELKKIFKEEQINSIRTKLESVDLVKIVQEASIVYSIKDPYEKTLVQDGENEADDANEVSETTERVYREFMRRTVVLTLNNLEYFALNFVYETADENVVYQSLHQTYLYVVKLLYYNIAVNNKTGEQKYYTNVIELFNIWKKVAEEQQQEEERSTDSSVVKGRKAEK